ncbi:MAG: hypothetical protein ABEJ98_00490 [Candidatus Nanohaloarchaea archaeon]
METGLEDILRSDEFRIFIVLLLVFGTFAHWNGDNEDVRLDLAYSIVDDGTFSIDSYESNTGDKSLINGHYYSDKAPLSSFAAVPSTALVSTVWGGLSTEEYRPNFSRVDHFPTSIARFLAVLTVSSVSGSLTAVLLYRILGLLGGLKRSIRALSAIVAGLGTLILPYSTTFHGTMLGTVFLMGGVYIWLRNQGKMGKRELLGVGALLGLGTTASYLIAIPGGIMGLLIAREKFREDVRDLSWGLAGGLAGLLPLLAYNTAIFGHPFDLTFFHHTPNFQDPVYGMVNSSLLLNLTKIPRLLFYPSFGLFLFSPVLLFSAVGIRSLWREHRELAVLITGSLGLQLLAISFLSHWALGSFFGPRYLLPSSTLLFIPAAFSLREGGTVRRYLFAATALVSAVFSASSISLWPLIKVPVEVYTEKMLSGEVLFNSLFGEFLPQLLNDGVRSPMLSYLLGFTEHLDMVIGPSIPSRTWIFSAFDSMVLYDMGVLYLLLPAFLVMAVFRHEIRDMTGEKRWKYLVGALVVLLLAGAGTTDKVYQDWYERKDTENVRWGKETPSISFYSYGEGERLLRFEARSFNSSQNVKLDLNNQEILDTGFKTSKRSYSKVISVEKGVNTVEFRPSDRCTVIGRKIGNDDVRCVTIGIDSFHVMKPEEGIYLGEGIEKRKDYMLFTGNSSFYINGDFNYSTALDIKSVGSPTKMTLLEDGEKVETTFVDGFGSNFSAPYRSVKGTARIDIITSCKDCRLRINRLDIRKLESVPEDDLYDYGKNWYRKIPSERYKWSTGRNASLYIYNHQDKAVERTLWVEGRSFGRGRTFRYYINGRETASFNWSTKTWRTITLPGGEKKRGPNKRGMDVRLEPGANELTISASSGCISVGRINQNNDVRCATFGLKKLYLTGGG